MASEPWSWSSGLDNIDRNLIIKHHIFTFQLLSCGVWCACSCLKLPRAKLFLKKLINFQNMTNEGAGGLVKLAIAGITFLNS